MGVKTPLSLQTLQTLFPFYNFTSIVATKDGVMDTTYIVSNTKEEYILKRYERALTCKVQEDAKRLEKLNSFGLHVPTLLAQKDGWYLYTKLQGEVVRSPSLPHIIALARFMAVFHNLSRTTKSSSSFLHNYSVKEMLSYTKKNFYMYYKKLASLHSYTHNNDGFIHGDIFKDNCVFAHHHIGVFDFIDGGNGSFSFDCGVAVMAFSPKTRLHYYSKVFLQTYNQHAQKKLTCKELSQEIQNAKKLYSLLRIYRYKTTHKILSKF
jgi:Ser/Thr protein kinase RdoA (MazF antagonist)